MRAYNKTYLSDISDKFGRMMDYAVNDCELDGDRFLHMLIASGLARQFETGDKKSIAKMSGVELAAKVIRLTTPEAPEVIPAHGDYRTAEYWAGRALAHYQWHTARTFASIIRYLPYSEIAAMYGTLHEADISKFYETAGSIIAGRCPQTNLKRLRDSAGFSGRDLAKESGVPLRTIQMYEQRRKDINRAQAITLAKIARALGCTIEDLLE